MYTDFLFLQCNGIVLADSRSLYYNHLAFVIVLPCEECLKMIDVWLK